MAAFSLSPETVDTVIDFLHDDKFALRACQLELFYYLIELLVYYYVIT